MSNPSRPDSTHPAAAAARPARQRATACPVCGKPATAEHLPFCGQGCRDRDLLQWLGEGYRVPGKPADPDLED